MSDGPFDVPTEVGADSGSGSSMAGGGAPARPPQHGPARPVTGDRAVDDALAAFDRALAEGPEAQAGAAAEAHRALQARLTAPTPPPAAPGEARPGPRG